MIRYFVTANIWLLFGLLIFVGRTYERSDPLRYSVFHGGQWFSPEAYTLLIFIPIAMAGVLFFLTWKTRDKSK